MDLGKAPEWRADGYWQRLDRATAGLDPVFGTLDLAALAHNALDMVRRANRLVAPRSEGRERRSDTAPQKSKAIRLASKSIRAREVMRSVLELPGYAGILAYTLPEALWLASTFDDVVVGYPSADRKAFSQLGRDAEKARRVTVMVDSIEQLDLIDAAIPPGGREPIRVCLELDASYRNRLLGHVGVWRSPVRTPAEATALARSVSTRKGFTLVGLMSYEAQIAGLGNAPAGKPLMGRIIRALQKASMAELLDRRAAVVRAVREVADLEFVNGGGTGSLESTGDDGSVTEIAAGSGLFGPHLFDNYAHFTPAPAAAFALPVVRRPAPDRVTLLGGGWIASGPPGPDRLPKICWPEGLTMVAREAAGEVQTPVVGPAAARLKVGDRVWLRHTKAGELSEHLNELTIVDGEAVAGTIPTYRGEGKAFA
jgi:D-serine deaminase-like pyridoxal phosphate-dependent protein